MCDWNLEDVVIDPGTPERHGRDGAWCDPCIVPLVRALNAGGIRTIASCCGHGRLPGRVTVAAPGGDIDLLLTNFVLGPDPVELTGRDAWFPDAARPLASDGLSGANTRPSAPLTGLQQRSADWVAEHHPGHGDIWRRLAKLTEEVGELNRAVIAADESRPNRGDPRQEAAQCLLVLMSIAHLLDVDLLEAAEAEYARATAAQAAPPSGGGSS